MTDEDPRLEPRARQRGALPAPLVASMRALPLAPLEFASSRLMHAILARNPGMLTRLGESSSRRFAIAPTDCPFVYILEPRPERPTLALRRSVEPTDWDARIAGPLVVLLGLLDGSYDGDAIFFSRDLIVEGDVSAVVALRNVIENADIDVGRLSGLPGPLATAVSSTARRLGDVVRRALDAPAGSRSAMGARTAGVPGRQ